MRSPSSTSDCLNLKELNWTLKTRPFEQSPILQSKRKLEHADFAPYLDKLVPDTTIEDIRHYTDWGTRVKEATG